MTRPPVAATDSVAKAQQLIFKHWESGSVSIGDDQISFPDWLAGIRLLFRALGRQGGRRHIRQGIDAHVDAPSHQSGPLELSRTANRSALLPIAVWLLDEWPDRLMTACARAKLRLGDLIDTNREHDPIWMKTAMAQLPYESRPRQKAIPPAMPFIPSVTVARQQIDLSSAIQQRLDGLKQRSKA